MMKPMIHISKMLCAIFMVQSISVSSQSIRFSEFYDSNNGAGLIESIVLLENGTMLGVGSNLNASNGNNQDGHHVLIDGDGVLLDQYEFVFSGATYNTQKILKDRETGSLYSAGYMCGHLTGDPIYCDYYLSKLNVMGDTLYTRILSRPDTSDFLLDMVQTRHNKLMLIGWSYNDTTDTNADLLFITVDTLGNELNRVTYGGVGTDYVNAGLTIDSLGHVIMVGYTKSFPNPNNGRSWVVKTDSIGNVLWHRTYSGVGGSTANGIRAARLADDSIIISGGKSGNGYLQKIDTAGTEIWIKHYEVSGGQGLWGVVGLEDGTIVACGVTDAIDGSQAGWLIKTDANGDTLWTRTFNASPFTDYLRNMTLMPNGDIVMVGFGRAPGQTNQDGWILRVDSMGCLEEGCFSVGVEELEPEERYFTAYPNPFASSTTIGYDLGESCELGCELRLYDLRGRAILREMLHPDNGKGKLSIDMGRYSNGLYYCALFGNGRLLQTEKLILMK